MADHLNGCPSCQTAAERLTAIVPAERSALLTAGTTPPPVSPPLGGYTDWRELGRGGHAVVYRAVDVNSGETVAVKLLRGGHLATPAEKEWFRAEATAAAGLDHPNVVQVLSVGDPTGVPHYVMEYVPGGSLADALDGSPRDAGTSARFVRAVASAVHHAHTRGVIHRDLKPGNVLLGDGPDPFAHPKVGDFGMAKGVERQDAPTPSRAVLGTPAYMAPEQAFGRSSRVGPTADVYSLGAILYELLTGRPPFRGETPYETLLQVRSLDPVPPCRLRPEVAADLERVCLKCLEKDPVRRYPSAAELAEELDRFLAGRPVRVRPPGTVAGVFRWVRRHPLPAGLIAVVVIAVLATLTAGVFALRAAEERAKRLEREREAGELLFTAGSFRDTVRRLDAFAAEGVPLSVQHRLLLVEALSETGDPDRATAELDRLGVEDLSAEHRGRATLRRAELALARDDPAARELIVSARSAELTADDGSYADALLAETVSEAVRHLERAVGLNSRHVQARCLLVHLLLLGGRVDDAVRVAEQSRVLFTDHPAFPQALAVAYAVRGEPGKADAALDTLTALRPADEVQPVRTLVAALPLIHRELRGKIYGGNYGHPGVAAEDRPRLDAVRTLVESTAPKWLTGMRLPPAVRPSVAAVFRTYGRAVFGLPPGESRVIPADELDRFADVVRRLPESVATMLHGLGLEERANDGSEEASRLEVYRQRLADSAAAFRRAAELPGWFDVRDIGLDSAAVSYSVAGKPNRPPPVTANAEWLAASADASRRRWQLGELPPEKLKLHVRVCANAGRFPLARAMLHDLELATPNDPGVEWVRADLEFKAGEHRAALAAAEKYLQAHPDDEGMKHIRTACRKALGLPPDTLPGGGEKDR